MVILVGIDEKTQPDQRQEGSAKSGDGDMGVGNDGLVAGRVFQRKAYGVERTQSGGQADDRQWKDDPGDEDRKDHSPGQEPPLPDRLHVDEHGRVDHGIVEGERNFK